MLVPVEGRGFVSFHWHQPLKDVFAGDFRIVDVERCSSDEGCAFDVGQRRLVRHLFVIDEFILCFSGFQLAADDVVREQHGVVDVLVHFLVVHLFCQFRYFAQLIHGTLITKNNNKRWDEYNTHCTNNYSKRSYGIEKNPR